jgi:hypothetical protein
MDNKPLLDREIILPILFGGLSVIGIAAVFIVGRLSDTRRSVPAADTATPFRFEYLGTEPGLSTLTPEATNTPAPTETDFVLPPLTFDPSTKAIPPTGQPLRTATVTASPTLAASVLSKFDDTYFQFLYDGDWVSQLNVSDTYQNTLHISFTVGSSVSYTFVGQQVIVSYQSGPSLGSVSITLDGLEFDVDQSSSETQLTNWQSALLVRGTHTLVIKHLSGGSVNLDSITIPDVSTPTPTGTVTP